MADNNNTEVKHYPNGSYEVTIVSNKGTKRPIPNFFTRKCKQCGYRAIDDPNFGKDGFCIPIHHVCQTHIKSASKS